MRRSAIDVGTNSVRLLVVDADGRTLAREVAITRLGQGVDATGVLAADALERTFEVLGAYRARWESLDATAPRIAATSAVRDAANRQDFFAGVRRVTGVDAEVLSGDEEAAAAFAGATAGPGAVDVAWPPVVIDIGGGSTELVAGGSARGAPVAGAVSLQLGSVRLTERCLAERAARAPDGSPPSRRQVGEARDLARTVVADGVARLLRDGIDLLRLARSGIGVAGTVTTLAQVDLGHDEWIDGRVHGHTLSAGRVREIATQLAGATRAQIAAMAGIAEGRRDVIAGGAIVLEAVMDVLGLDEVVVSEADILDGLVR